MVCTPCRFPDATLAVRYTEERVEFGIDALERAALGAATMKNTARRRFAQGLLVSCHTALGTSASTSTRATMLCIKTSYRMHPEAEGREARREARRSQHAHRILDEGGGHVPQDSRVDVAFAAERSTSVPSGACAIA